MYSIVCIEYQNSVYERMLLVVSCCFVYPLFSVTLLFHIFSQKRIFSIEREREREKS